MRIFNHPNMNAEWKCPICHTSEDKPILLNDNTQFENNIEAEQVHVDCISDLRIVKLSMILK